MSNRKLSSIKQLSLHYETPTAEQRRHNFKKQFSEDIPDSKSAWLEKDLSIRISLSAKLHKKERDKPPPVKLAWAEDEQKDHSKKEKQENSKLDKYLELRKGTTEKISKQSSLEKDSVLYSRQELAERLRQVWKERDQQKQNLNIFLAHNINEDTENNNQDKESSLLSENESFQPKIISPGKTRDADNNFKTIFQKKLRKSIYPNLFEANCLPPKIKDNYLTPENRSSTVVVVPVIENEFTSNDTNKVTSTHSTPREKPSNSSTKENVNFAANPKPIDNIVIRPSTAAQKREGFKKRSNSAFQGSITNNTFRPPLLRASSVPSKQEHAKPKFLKRRAKTAKRKESKNEAKDKVDGDGEKKNEKNDNVTNAAEIITMVSLTSPAGSDTEELPQIENNQSKSKTESPINKEIKLERNFSLRKAVKSVSFQQSSIHAVRSFSASFPARRGSFASALTFGNNGIMKTSKDSQKVQEKRSTTASSHEDDDDYDERVAKRRLVRTKSVPLQNSFEEDDQNLTPRKPQDCKFSDEKCKIENDQTLVESENVLASEEKKSDTKDNDSDKIEAEQNTEMKFETTKEKQCWDMYCKMSQKGVSVSFDTILRGMLTPTEYRMRRKSLIPLEDC